MQVAGVPKSSNYLFRIEKIFGHVRGSNSSHLGDRQVLYPLCYALRQDLTYFKSVPSTKSSFYSKFDLDVKPIRFLKCRSCVAKLRHRSCFVAFLYRGLHSGHPGPGGVGDL